MFTGIVAELGEVAGIEHRGDAARLTIRGDTEGVIAGESIAVNGVCLTVTGVLDGTFTADVMGETLDRTGLGALTPGAPVNLERSVRLADRLGGHLVQGHVDATGTIISRSPKAHWDQVRISLPARHRQVRGAQGIDLRGRREPHRLRAGHPRPDPQRPGSRSASSPRPSSAPPWAPASQAKR